MKFVVKFSKNAGIDLREAAEWYENKKKGLGIELLEEVSEKIGLIKENPHIFQIRFEECRSCNLRKFPYKIIYSVDQSIVRIWAIYHHKRDPAKWKR